jgi:hypothetical protein
MLTPTKTKIKSQGAARAMQMKKGRKGQPKSPANDLNRIVNQFIQIMVGKV